METQLLDPSPELLSAQVVAMPLVGELPLRLTDVDQGQAEFFSRV